MDEDGNIDAVLLEIPKGRDDSQTNPALHKLYVEWAARHLGMVDKMIRKLSGEGNLNTLDFAQALILVRESKIKHDAAYRDADRIIRSMKGERLDEPMLADEGSVTG